MNNKKITNIDGSHHQPQNAIKLRPNGFEKNSALKGSSIFSKHLTIRTIFSKKLDSIATPSANRFSFFYAFKIIGKALGILAALLFLIERRRCFNSNTFKMKKELRIEALDNMRLIF
ncbi:MAG: hypothetical protein KBT58_05570 [Bizionia sp.]|nr:hypothetical protein [Bizionia sp.]